MNQLDRLRNPAQQFAALSLQAKKNARVAAKPAVPPPESSRVILLMLWRNFTIKKRRKFETMVMLLQVFIWFGINGIRFLSTTHKYWLLPVGSQAGSEPPKVFARSQLPSNQPILFTLESHPDYDDRKSDRAYEAGFKVGIDEYFGEHPTVNTTIAKEVIQVFKRVWERTVGATEPGIMANEGETYQRLKDEERAYFGIKFNALNLNDRNVSVSLMYRSDEIPQVESLSSHRAACRDMEQRFDARELHSLNYDNRRSGCEAGKYIASTFVLAESILHMSIVRALSNARGNPREKVRQPLTDTMELPGVSIQLEDYPLHINLQSSYPDLATSMPLYVLFAFLRFTVTAIFDLVAEKESKLREVMKINGLTSYQYWASWLYTSMGMSILYTSLAVIIARMCNMHGESSYAVLFVFYYFYILSLSTFGYLISTFFESAQAGGAAGLIINAALNGMGVVLTALKTKSQWVRAIASCSSHVSFALGLDENLRGLPMRRVTLFNLFNFTEHHMGFYTVMLIIDAFGYWALAWYMDTVFAGSYGQSRPWYYPITESFNFLSRSFMGESDYFPIPLDSEMPEEFDTASMQAFAEPVNPVVKAKGVAISIRNLRKHFTVRGEVKKAVDDLSLDIYKSEIFALLGHNGAGKTTTISILTGMLSSDGGEAWLNGYSTKHASREAQQAVSVCPQHNIFIDELYCIEHLCLFAGLRGIDVQEPLLKLQNPRLYGEELMGAYQKRQQENQMRMMMGQPIVQPPSETKTWAGVLNTIDRFGITSKLFASPRSLSGGQKRRLWLAIALLAEPSVVFLDEPTSGVDPVGRQEIWKVIQEERKSGRCIVLTTHHMEEADILADRKAVMAAGRIRCLGTSLFLKSKFGIGYYLEVQLSGTADERTLNKARESITNLVMKYVSDARPVLSEEDAGTMAALSVGKGIMIFALPLAQIAQYGPLLTAIESGKSSMSIEEYAVSMSTLEEVFFKLGSAQTDEEMAALMANKGPVSIVAPSSEPMPEKAQLQLSELGVHGRRRSSTALPAMSSGGDSAADHPTGDAYAADLTRQIVRPSGKGSFVSQLQGVTYLRYAQVFHNKKAFFFDVLLPTLMFLVGQLLKRGGPDDLGKLFERNEFTFNLDDYDTHLNSSIPYYVDPKLNEQGRLKVAAILENLPFRDKMLPLADIMRPELLSLMTQEEYQTQLRKLEDTGIQLSATYDFVQSPRSEKDYNDRRPLPMKKFGVGSRVEAEDLPLVFHIPEILQTTRRTGMPLRSFVWQTSVSDLFGVPMNYYPTAISFEAAKEPLSDKTVFHIREDAPHEVLIRYFYNPYAIHALPSFINGLTESTANIRVGEQRVKVHTESRPVFADMPIHITGLTWTLYSLLSLGMIGLPVRFGNQVMFDQSMKTKHSLVVMGCPFTVYWAGTFLLNWLIKVGSNTLIVGMFAFFIPLFTKHSASLVAAEAVMLCYSATMLTYAYFWTFVFDNNRSYGLFMNYSILALAVGPAYIVSMFHDLNLEVSRFPLLAGWSVRQLSAVIHKFFALTLAPYLPMGTIMSLVMIMNQADSEKRIATLSEFFAFSNGVVWCIMGAFLQFFIYGTIVVYLDSRLYTAKERNPRSIRTLKHWKETRAKIRQQVLEQTGNEAMVPAQFQSHKDADVLTEEARVDDIIAVFNTQKAAKEARMEVPRHFPKLNGRAPKELPLIIVHDFHHLYMPNSAGAEPVVAVKGLSLAVSKGEVLGLLGPNGAGKSTSINLLSCDPHLDAPCEGDGYLGGISVVSEPQNAFEHLGLVPQFDALWPEVTVDDNLYTFAKIKSMSRAERQRAISSLLVKLDLIPHQHKRVNELSGGNKRRASVAVAFLGNPKYVLMDEPSSGIDPEGRRKLLQMIRSEGRDRAIVVVTHR